LELFNEIYEESMSFVRISNEIPITISKVPKEQPKKSTVTKRKPKPKAKRFKGSGHCIRCDTKIKLNPMVPYCKKCFSSWKKYENPDYKDDYCHICGKDNFSTIEKPSCYSCYKSNKSKLEFPVE